jgi:hypothetical protein
MAYKVFLSNTGSGKTIFEGDVLNGYCSPDCKDVVIKFFSNDRGYTAASFGFSDKSGVPMDLEGAKSLRNELAALFDANLTRAGVFTTESSGKHFRLGREVEGAPIFLSVQGTDPRFGSSHHRGDPEALKKVLAEFDTVLKTLEEVKSGKLAAKE